MGSPPGPQSSTVAMSRGRRGRRTSRAASALLLHTPASSPPKPPPMKPGSCKDGGGGAPSPSLVVKPDGTPARQELRLGAGDEEKRPAAARSGTVEAGSGPPWRDLLGGGVGRWVGGGGNLECSAAGFGDGSGALATWRSWRRVAAGAGSPSCARTLAGWRLAAGRATATAAGRATMKAGARGA